MPSGSSEELSSLRGGPSRFSISILDQADNPRRLVTHDDDADVSSCAYPYATVLDGMRWWVSVTAFRSRFTVLRISRDRGDRASPLHLGERNCTSTGPQLSKTLRSRPLIPGCEAISRERIAASRCVR